MTETNLGSIEGALKIDHTLKFFQKHICQGELIYQGVTIIFPSFFIETEIEEIS